MIRILIILLALAVNAQAGGVMFYAGGVEGDACLTDSVDTENTGTKTGETFLDNPAAFGQSFVCSAGDLSAIEVLLGFTSGGEVELRVGTTSNLSTYLVSQTFTVPATSYVPLKIIIDSKTALTAGTYYFGLIETSGDVRIAQSADDYASGTKRSSGSSSWNLSIENATLDLIFKVYLCD